MKHNVIIFLRQVIFYFLKLYFYNYFSIVMTKYWGVFQLNL